MKNGISLDQQITHFIDDQMFWIYESKWRANSQLQVSQVAHSYESTSPNYMLYDIYSEISYTVPAK